MARISNLLLNNKSAFKWIVLLFDILLCVCSLFLASWIISILAPSPAGSLNVATKAGIVGIVSGLFFFFFRTPEVAPAGENFKSTLRSLDALSGTFIALMLLNLALKMTGRPPLITNFELILSTLTSIFLVGGYRFIAGLFLRQRNDTETLLSIAVYGSDAHIAEIKTALENAAGQRYQLTAAFVEQDPGAAIEGIRVYPYEMLPAIIEKERFGLLLFAGAEISHEQKSQVIDLCLKHDVAVKDLPLFETWINGHLTVSQLRDVSIGALLGRGENHEHSNQVLQLLASKRILITGAAGSIGSELAKQVAATPHAKLILCDQNETGLYELAYVLRSQHEQFGNPEIFIADVRDIGSMEHIFKTCQPQVVFHAAAYKHVPMMEANPSEAVRNNISGTRVVADLSLEYGVERFQLVSTDKAINPTNVMGATKRIAEMYVQCLGMTRKKMLQPGGANAEKDSTKQTTRFITTRFGNVIDSNGSVIPRFREQIAAGGPVTVTHPDVIRYFMTISEACALVLEAVTMGKGGEVFRFDMGEPVRIAELANKMIRLAGYRPDADIRVIFSGLRPGEKLYEEMLHKEQETVTRHNKKILVSKMAAFDYHAVNESINILLETASQNRDEEVVRQMKRIIPEYISNNSVYQSFDERAPSTAMVNR